MGSEYRLPHGRAELCGRAVAVGQADGARTATSAPGEIADPDVPLSACHPARAQVKTRLADDAALGVMVSDYATAANAALASVRIRSTMERKPFERCGVRFSRKPILSKSASASIARISLALLPE